MAASAKVERARIAELVELEEKRLEDATPKSYELYKRAAKSLPMGVSSSYQARDPYPVYFSHGKGSKIYSVDGLIRTINAPPVGRGDYWDVCAIDGRTGNITLINRILDGQPAPASLAPSPGISGVNGAAPANQEYCEIGKYATGMKS